jgi:16S rRNA (cytosine967-C5)-methyltransferase
MKAETPRDLALKALNRHARSPAFSPVLLEDLFRARRDLDDRDRAFATQLVQGVLRWRLRLDWIVEQSSRFPLRKIDPPVLEILRLALYQIFFLDRVPESAAVNEAVKQAKAAHPNHVVSFVNGLLRNICRHREGLAYPDQDKDPVRYLSIYHSYPAWLVEKWISELGRRRRKLFWRRETAPPSDGEGEPPENRAPCADGAPAGGGLSATPTRHSPLGVVIEGLRGRIDRLGAFNGRVDPGAG